VGAGLTIVATVIAARRLLEFALLSYVLILVPGPNVLFVVSRSLQLGRLHGVAAVIGGQTGVYVQVLAVALGVGAIFVAIALVSDSMWALLAGTARSWFTRSPRRLELIGGASGLVMIGIGASLALTGGKD
jgi:threonine/homoserine/homoserine lactone efflux protein